MDLLYEFTTWKSSQGCSDPRFIRLIFSSRAIPYENGESWLEALRELTLTEVYQLEINKKNRS
jgi:hypothetical protein